MEEMLTIEEIENRFDSEWVLIGDPLTDELLEVMGGKVLWHSRDRDEIHRMAMELHPRRFAVLHVGKPPEEMESAL